MSLQFLQILASLLEVCQQASASLPLIIVLGLTAGRRGNGQFCIQGNKSLLNFTLLVAGLGIIYFPVAYFCLILPFHNTGASALKPFFESPGLPWSCGMLAQTCGFAVLFIMKRALINMASQLDKYPLAMVKKPLLLGLVSSLLFLGTFFLMNWPFAGLPVGMDMDRAFFAVLRNAFRHFFMSFCPAGALALIFTIYRRHELGGRNLLLALRWLSVWAFIGYLPYLLQVWAILIGLGLRGNVTGYFPGSLMNHLLSVTFLSVAVSLWCFQALSRKPWPFLLFLAFLFFMARIFLPLFFQNLLEM